MNIARSFRKTKTVILQTTVIALITLSLGEIALRIYNHYNPSFVFYSGSYNRFRGKPFANDWNFKLNSLGFKDKEFTKKTENAYRILGIGDSFSYGVVPYENNYLTLIESQLQQTYPYSEVLNMGIPSTGPRDYLSLLLNEGMAYQPDMVLLSFFTGNDFDKIKDVKFYEHSYIASLLHYITNLRPKYEGIALHGEGQYCDECPTFAHDEYLKIESQRSLIYRRDNSDFDNSIEGAISDLSRIKYICDKDGIALLVVIIPDEVQVNRELRREMREAHFPNVALDQWNNTRPNNSLSDTFEKLGIEYIDLYERFSSASSERLYKPRDSHWNIAGNQLAADVIAKAIQAHLE